MSYPYAHMSAFCCSTRIARKFIKSCFKALLQNHNLRSISNCRFAIDILDFYYYIEYMFGSEVNMEMNITINERITDLRIMSGLSQKELAEKADIATSTLCRIEQGKISKELAKGYRDGNAADQELDKLIGWDFNWYHTVGTSNHLMPRFEPKVLQEFPDGTKRIQNSDGLIERIKPGKVSIPSEDDYTLKDRKAFEEFLTVITTYTYMDAFLNFHSKNTDFISEDGSHLMM